MDLNMRERPTTETSYAICERQFLYGVAGTVGIVESAAYRHAQRGDTTGNDRGRERIGHSREPLPDAFYIEWGAARQCMARRETAR